MAQTHTPEESLVVRSCLLLTRHTITKDPGRNNPQMGDFISLIEASNMALKKDV